MDASENFCYGKHQNVLERKDWYKISCVKKLIFYWIVRKLVFIWTIRQNHCFRKPLQWWALCKNDAKMLFFIPIYVIFIETLKFSQSVKSSKNKIKKWLVLKTFEMGAPNVLGNVESRVGSRTAEISKMENFAIIVNGFHLMI